MAPLQSNLCRPKFAPVHGLLRLGLMLEKLLAAPEAASVGGQMQGQLAQAVDCTGRASVGVWCSRSIHLAA